MSTPPSSAPRPWYREPAPWLLAAGPAAVVIAALFTAWLAVSRPDTVIAEDYYRRGLSPKPEELASQARTTGLTAELMADAVAGKLRLVAYGGMPESPTIKLSLHPHSGQGRDLTLDFAQQAAGRYETAMPALSSGLWEVSVVLGERRLAGVWKVPGPASIALSAGGSEER